MGKRKSRTQDLHNVVYHRAGWRCQMPECLCPDGRALDQQLRGTNELWAPSIDHIEPLATGGRDGPGNLRAAHRECNRAAAAAELQQAGVVAPEPLASAIGDLYPDLAERFGL